ncbi:ionotropic receptor 93a [Phymastichus coffea]|uniref:ionotropic receptor 93a n=1 Tax=Phymastichus coffea TaxID=108790 RepID=UPI00273A9977|nr:ionotropic receptor 93a [Phymastichus coffea]
MLLMSLLLLLRFEWTIGYNDFPSLMTANATMAVVVEKTFFKDDNDYRDGLADITDLVIGIIKDNMKKGGIDTFVFGDTNTDLKRDYTILLSVATCQTTWNLFKRALQEKLVHLAITDSDCPRLPEGDGISLPLIDSGEELAQIFLDLRMSATLAWTKINFLHDDTFDRDMISRVVKALSVELPNKRLLLSTRAIFSVHYDKSDSVMKQRIHNMLADFHVEQLGSCFMVIISIDMVPTMMEVAKSLRMVNPESQWLYVISDGAGHDANVTMFLDLLAEGENVAFIYNATNLGPECSMGLACHIKELVRALARELTELRSGTTNTCGECISWKIASAITWGASFAINEAKQHRKAKTESKKKAIGELIDSGTWSSAPGVRMNEVLFPHIEHGFRGRSLPVSIYHNPPWQILSLSNTDQLEFGGLVFNILDYLSLKLNFTYTMQLPSDNDVLRKSQHDNNNNTIKSKKTVKFDENEAAISVARKVPAELIELVRDARVFLAAAAVTIGENTRNINYTYMIAQQTYSLLSAKPKLLSRALLFMAPFTSETWACLTSTLLLVGPFLYMIIKLSPKPMEPDEVVGLSTTWQCTWYVYGALLQQGGMSLPKADSARLIVATWWIVVMVVVATYSGNLIAFLTFPRMDDPIDTVDDLIARQNEFTWVYPNGSALQNYLVTASQETDKYKKLLDGAKQEDPTEPRRALAKVKDSNYVLIDWRTSEAFLMRLDLIETGVCNFHVGTENFMHENMGLLVAANNPYIDLINNAIIRMHEAGLISKWSLDVLPLKDKCFVNKASQEVTNHKVDMGDMQGIFFVLAIGFTLAVVLIGSEFIWHHRKILAEKNLIRPFAS